MRNALVNTFARLRKDEDGVTLVEYGIALVLAIAVGTLLLTSLAGEVGENVTEAATVMQGSNALPAADAD